MTPTHQLGSETKAGAALIKVPFASFVISHAPACGNDGVCRGANSTGSRSFASQPVSTALKSRVRQSAGPAVT